MNEEVAVWRRIIAKTLGLMMGWFAGGALRSHGKSL